MQSSLEKLLVFSRLEREKKYEDSAIIGGFVSILGIWEGEARNDGVPEEIIQSTAETLRNYNGLSPKDREQSLIVLWKKIREKVPAFVIKKQLPPRKVVAVPPQDTSEMVPEPPPADFPSLAEPLVPEPIRPSTQPSDSGPLAQIPRADFSNNKPAPPASRPPQGKPTYVPHNPGRAESRPGGVNSKRPIALNASLTVLAGIGPKNAIMFSRLGMNNLGDMLYNFPRRYEDYSKLKPIRDVFYDQVVTVIGTVISIESRPLRKDPKKSIVEAVINDGTAGLRLTWFNRPYLVNQIKVDNAISVSGRIDQYLGRLVMSNPDWEPVEVENLHTNRIVPIYPLTVNVNQKWLRGLIFKL